MHLALQEWESATPTSHGDLLAGRSFAQDKAARSLARHLTRTRRLKVFEAAEGLYFHAQAFVGRVQLGEWQVTIRPKVSGERLLNLFRFAYNLRDLQRFAPVGFALSEANFQDLLVEQLAAEATELLQRGWHRHYERHEELSTLRGQINFTRYVGTMASARGMVPCTHYTRSENTFLNQVLLAGLRMARRMTTSLDLRTAVGRLVKLLEVNVLFRPVRSADLALAHHGLNRITAHYAPALTLISLLLAGAGISDDGQPSTTPQIPGFLFDMNRFFQTLLSRFLHEHLDGCGVSDEHRLKGVYSYESRHNPLGKQAPTLRPDLVISRRGLPPAVIDAKYRDLWMEALPREMLYQLTLYALSQGNAPLQSTILYPTDSKAAEDQVLRFHSPTDGRPQATIKMRPVSLSLLERLTRPPNLPDQRRQAKNLAKWLVFGEHPQA